MASGTRGDLRLMMMLTSIPEDLLSSVLTPEEAAEHERQGYKVAYIPVVKHDG